MALAVALSLAVSVCGCGQEPEQAEPEDVELLDPVGVAAGYEAAARRNLYDADVYPAFVCPYVEEYGLESGFSFADYDAYPGETVKRGGALLHGNTESIDKQIEALEKSVAQEEESYLEFVKETEESLVQPRADRQNYQNILDNLDRSKPEEYILQEAEEGITEEEVGTVTEVPNPEYEEWEQQYSLFKGELQKAAQTVIEGEESLRQRKELYELDHAYNLTRLAFLKEDKGELTLTAGIRGEVAAIRFLSQGDWVGGKEALMAVGDTEQPVLRCDFVNKTVINKAQDVYAILHGERYEVEYQPMESEEYQRLAEENDKVYSTFYFAADGEEVAVGDFAVIVVLHESRENVVTVPKSAIVKEEGASFVYVQEGDRSVYTPVQTGMSDGVYTEILSGIQEGDRVRAEGTVTGGDGGTARLERGSVKSSFRSSGHLYYPSATWVTNPVEYGTCYYVERCVALYQQIKKGDVLARVRVVPDELELDRNVRRLQREQERLADLRADGEEQNKKAIEAKLETIAELEELIGNMRADFAIREIKAPTDGIITDMGYYEEDQLVQRGDRLFQVADGNTNYIAIDDENGILTYGNEVTVEYDVGGGQTYSTEGKVVSLNSMSLSKSLVSDTALVAISSEIVGETAGSSQDDSGWWSRVWYNVSADTRVMDNVLLIPKRAVIEKNGVTYVRVLQENGEVRLQSFIAGGSDGANYWVAEGLTEGMEICLE